MFDKKLANHIWMLCHMILFICDGNDKLVSTHFITCILCILHTIKRFLFVQFIENAFPFTRRSPQHSTMNVKHRKKEFVHDTFFESIRNSHQLITGVWPIQKHQIWYSLWFSIKIDNHFSSFYEITPTSKWPFERYNWTVSLLKTINIQPFNKQFSCCLFVCLLVLQCYGFVFNLFILVLLLRWIFIRLIDYPLIWDTLEQEHRPDLCTNWFGRGVELNVVLGSTSIFKSRFFLVGLVCGSE